MNKQSGEWFRVDVSDSQTGDDLVFEVFSLDPNGAFLSALHRLGGLGRAKHKPHGRIRKSDYFPSRHNNFRPRFSLKVGRMNKAANTNGAQERTA